MNGLSYFSDTGSFLESLSDEGDRTAIVFGNRDYAYKTVARLSAATIASAKDAGLPHCGRIATILPDHPITAIAILGLTSVANILPLNPTLTVRELQTIAREAGVCGVLYDGGSAVSAELGERLELGKFALDLETGAVRSMEAPASNTDSGNASGLTLLTSGSTGDPKRVPLSGAMLLASAANIARTLSLGQRDRAAHILPMFHIGALVDLLLAPLFARGSVAIGEDRTPQSMRSLVLTQRANWVQFVPTMLIRCLEEFGDRDYQEMGERLRFIRSVSADLAPELQATAERRFGVPVIQMYGMTEAAGQIASNPLPPGKRKPGTVGLPAGPEVAILDDAGSPASAGSIGEICVRGPTVMPAYEGTPRESHFFGPWLRTGDLGYFDEDGYLVIAGRLKEQINRGGEKISPVEIERAALAVPGVREAVAYASPHRSLGEQVKLAVVADPAISLSEPALQAALARVLAEPKRPRRIRFLAAMPRLASGKIDRRALQTERSAADAGTDTPSSPLARIAGDCWTQVLKFGSPRAEDDFFECGGDSLSGAQFLLLLIERTGLALEGNVLFEAPRFGQLVALLETLGPGSPAPDDAISFVSTRIAAWPGQPKAAGSLILRLGESDKDTPLFFCTQGEGDIHSMRRALRQSRPVYAMRSLNGKSRQSEDDRNLLAQKYAGEIIDLYAEGLIVIGGFCEGAELAARIAERLQQAGRQVRLFLSIDHWFAEPTGFPVAHVWSRHPFLSPSGLFSNPARGLQILHPAGSVALQIEADHFDIMRPGNIAPVGDMIERALATPFVAPAREAIEAFHLRKAAYKAEIRARTGWLWRQNTQKTIKVRIVNKSSATWPPGMALAAYQVPDKSTARMIEQAAGRIAIASSVPASTEIELTIAVQITHRGWVKLLLAMEDDAVAPFGAGGQFGRWIWVRAA